MHSTFSILNPHYALRIKKIMHYAFSILNPHCALRIKKIMHYAFSILNSHCALRIEKKQASSACFFSPFLLPKSSFHQFYLIIHNIISDRQLLQLLASAYIHKNTLQIVNHHLVAHLAIDIVNTCDIAC